MIHLNFALFIKQALQLSYARGKRQGNKESLVPGKWLGMLVCDQGCVNW